MGFLFGKWFNNNYSFIKLNTLFILLWFSSSKNKTCHVTLFQSYILAIQYLMGTNLSSIMFLFLLMVFITRVSVRPHLLLGSLVLCCHT